MKIRSILIVTYDWPPRNSIAVYRPYAWAKCWAEHGVNITIITAKKCLYDEPLDLSLPHIDGVEVIEVAYRGELGEGGGKNNYKRFIFDFLKKYSYFFKKIIGVNYDIRDRWARLAIPKSIEIASKKDVDVVISTYGPRSCHFIGSEVKRSIKNIKWVADYRDLWSIRHNNKMTAAQEKKEKSTELKVLKSADFVMTVSKPLADDLSGFLGKSVATVFNGFDAEWAEAERAIRAKQNSEIVKEKIKIVYTGMIYPGWQDPSPLFAAVRNLINSKKIKEGQVEIDFYGQRQPGLLELVRSHSAEGFVRVHGHVSREIAVRKQADADLLLLLESGANAAKGVLTGKIFEYMVSGTPILSLGSKPDSAIGAVISETGVGVVCADDVESIENSILNVLRGDVRKIFMPNMGEIMKYSRRAQSESLLIELSRAFGFTDRL